ncbi:MAG: hypothetical protein R3E87_18500 [Burkholderiaceae bacterium]
MKPNLFITGLAMTLAATVVGPLQAGQEQNPTTERGRYLVMVGGCNDCHTPGFAESGGKTAVNEWLTGSLVGFQGPWGTTYPTNLRLSVQGMNEAAFLAKARTAMRPPMPSPSLMAMTDADLRSLYRFIRSLGLAGVAAPDYVPPGRVVNTPYVEFMPKNLPPRADARRP